MDSVRVNPLICQECQKEFTSVSNKNRHLRKMHNHDAVKVDRMQHIMCSLCPNEDREKFTCYNNLNKHYTNIHQIKFKESIINFRSREEFEAWRGEENRDVNYACTRTVETKKGDKLVDYYCNRSNYRGYKSNCVKCNVKLGGSIQIQGICPSRFSLKISTDGLITVTFVETHVGHEEVLIRAQRLSKCQQNHLVEKLVTGITTERIIQDARQVQGEEVDRLNVITRGDLAYLVRKYNIDNKRHPDDMIATAMKVQEWNRQGENYAFLFKRVGECYPGLRNEDFAVAYMNGIMEKKLRDFKRIICVDGTHGTNKNDWELTVVLVKDENNMGFPVAFLLSNRKDQLIQEHFFAALKSRLCGPIEAEFFMSDDDPKYFNAWTNIMRLPQKPRRLLCTWHVIKNWNTKGRSKIKKVEIRQEMKKEMRKILRETDSTTFMQLKENYFKHLEEEGENDFLQYLQK